MPMPPVFRTTVQNITRTGSVLGYSLGGIVIIALAVIGLLALFHRA